jgi:DNA-binding NarL/FixJ family response regulator
VRPFVLKTVKTNVLIIGGSKLLREGITLLLRRHDDVQVVGEASTAEDGVKLVAPLSSKVIIFTLTGPVPSAAEAIRFLRAAKPKPKVVVLTINAVGDGLRPLLEAGANACLTKECSSEELVTAIRAAAAGRTYLSPQLLGTVVTGYAKAAKRTPLRPALSPRERDVLRRIASGQNAKQIALALGVGPKTVETHRRRLMDKLRLYSVAELTTYALREELLLTADPQH